MTLATGKLIVAMDYPKMLIKADHHNHASRPNESPY